MNINIILKQLCLLNNNCFILILVYTLVSLVSTVDGQVKCFCDRESCDENLLCQGEFCFIGLRRDEYGDSPKLRQHCGSSGELPFLAGGVVRCEERIDSWQEVCKCAEDFCNTFAYLRASIDSRQENKKEIVQFTKQDVPYPPVHQRPEHTPRAHSSSLIVLLVIIPLSVGGFAVCLIFLNYHCKMC